MTNIVSALSSIATVATMLPELVAVSLLLFMLLYKYLTRGHGYWGERGVPFLRPLPFFGNTLSMYLNRQSMGHFAYSLYKKFDAPLVGYYLGDRPGLLVRDVAVIKNVLGKDSDFFRDHTVVCDEKADPVTAHLMFVSKYEEWKELRRKSSPVFSTGKLRHLINDFSVGCSGALLAFLEGAVDANPVMNARRLSELFTTDSIMSTLFGIRTDCLGNPDGKFGAISKDLFNWSIFTRGMDFTYYFMSPLFVRLFKMKFVTTETREFLKGMFWDVITSRERGAGARNDFIDLMVQMKKDGDARKWTRHERDWLIAQAIQLYIAGFETSSSSIAFALWEFARNQKVQEKAIQEVLQVKQKHGEFSYDTLLELEYLTMCFKETTRKYPSLPFSDRTCSRDYEIPGHRLVIKKGSPVLVSLIGVHRDPSIFPQPYQFRPERFSKENIKDIPDYAHIPFGAGPRKCIGERFAHLSFLCAMAHFLSEYCVSVCDKTPENLKFIPRGFTILSTEPIYLMFRKHSFVSQSKSSI